MKELIETLIETHDSVIGKIAIPEMARPFCDTWGNINIEPVSVIEERHGDNFISVFIYNINQVYFFGYQFRLNNIILQKAANITDPPEGTEEMARRAARDELYSVVSEKRLHKVFITFDRICYNQPELF